MKKKSPPMQQTVVYEAMVKPEGDMIAGVLLTHKQVYFRGSNKIPVLFDGNHVGTAEVYEKENNVMANVRFDAGILDVLVLDKYLATNGTMKTNPETGEAVGFILDSVSLADNALYEKQTSLRESKELYESKKFAKDLYKRLKAKGWTHRRIVRHFFVKYKIHIS